MDYEIPYVGRFRTHRGTCFRSAQGVEGADRGHRLRHRGEPGAYRGLAGAAAALPRQSERAGNGIHLYPAQHRRHPRRVRLGQGEGRTVQGHHRRRGRRIGRFRGIHRSDPPARPADHLPDVQTAAAVQAVLHVRRHRRGRQIRRRRRQPGHGDRRARTRSGRSRQPQLGQRPHRVHARLWRCGRLRQQGDRRRPAEVLRSGHPHPRQAHRFRKVRAAHLLLSERHRIFDRRRSGRHQILGIRLSDRFGRRHQHLQGRWRSEDRQHLLQTAVRHPLRLRPDPVLQPCELQFADSLRPFPEGTCGQSRAVSDA